VLPDEVSGGESSLSPPAAGIKSSFLFPIFASPLPRGLPILLVREGGGVWGGLFERKSVEDVGRQQDHRGPGGRQNSLQLAASGAEIHRPDIRKRNPSSVLPPHPPHCPLPPRLQRRGIRWVSSLAMRGFPCDCCRSLVVAAVLIQDVSIPEQHPAPVVHAKAKPGPSVAMAPPLTAFHAFPHLTPNPQSNTIIFLITISWASSLSPRRKTDVKSRPRRARMSWC
jgi:hypothetical protein